MTETTDHFTGRVAVVTGASSGLGDAIARRLVARGMTVVAAARRTERLEALAAELGDRIDPVTCDVRDTASVDALAAHVEATHGACHLLVNNAGVGGGPFDVREDLEDTLHTVDVNLMGPLRCMAAFVALLEDSAPSQIVNVGSVSGKLGIGPAGYVASKFGLNGTSETLGLAWKDRGITVTQLNPGYVETEGFPQTQVKRGPMGRLVAEPDVVADAVERAVAERALEITVPRFYEAFIQLRHTANPVYRAIASRMARARGNRD